MITVIGLDGSALSAAVTDALATATLVVGGRRHLDAVDVPSAARTVVLGNVGDALDELGKHDGDAVVLASGDPGFFGIVRAMHERGLTYVVHPAVSSVAQAFARAGVSWDDAVVVSAHGRDLRPAVNTCRAHHKVAVLTTPGAGPAELAAALDDRPRQLVVAELLGTAGETVTPCTRAEAAARGWRDPNVVLVLDPALDATSAGWSWPRVAVPDGWALPEDDFEHRDAMVTKAEVRALALAKLAPRPGTLVWDVGAGSGSVAVECARFGAAVVALERDAEQCARIEANAAAHGVRVDVVRAEAPAALDALPEPDAVFVGGGGTAVVAAVAARRPTTVVVALAALERVGPAADALTTAGYRVAATQLQASRLAALPDGAHRLAATNPVVVVWGERR
ncbi:MAG: precorrin-6y C5,15-methyltransferase (decarboxylating) subunit CbiE [Streptosporangiales bacterium]|nr:precorrin-6y C5,15-methyltransferase (decarboxylating) subunit CbiE [Streptosporangiales bacterium]